MDFRSAHTFETRQLEAQRIVQKFPGRVPVIVERSNAAKKTVPLIDKQKFLVPGDLTLGQFVFVIRTRMKLPPESALFCFVGNSLPTTGTLMRELYGRHRENDGFLYVSYCGENTFGSRFLDANRHEDYATPVFGSTSVRKRFIDSNVSGSPLYTEPSCAMPMRTKSVALV
jgi:GABA(A) receptor-associated protein